MSLWRRFDASLVSCRHDRLKWSRLFGQFEGSPRLIIAKMTMHRAGSDPGCEVCRGRAGVGRAQSPPLGGGRVARHRLRRRRGGFVGHRSGSGDDSQGTPGDCPRRGADGPHPTSWRRPAPHPAGSGIQAALEALVDPLTRGDPTSPLRWTCKSRAKLAAALTEQGWRVSSTVCSAKPSLSCGGAGAPRCAAGLRRSRCSGAAGPPRVAEAKTGPTAVGRSGRFSEPFSLARSCWTCSATPLQDAGVDQSEPLPRPRLRRTRAPAGDPTTACAPSACGCSPARAHRSTPPPVACRLVIGIFAALADFERELIRERTLAGLKAARAKGQQEVRAVESSGAARAGRDGTPRHLRVRALAANSGSSP